MKKLTLIIEWLWLGVALASLVLFLWLWIAEGFYSGKAWVYLISLAVGAAMWRLRRGQRMADKG